MKLNSINPFRYFLSSIKSPAEIEIEIAEDREFFEQLFPPGPWLRVIDEQPMKPDNFFIAYAKGEYRVPMYRANNILSLYGQTCYLESVLDERPVEILIKEISYDKCNSLSVTVAAKRPRTEDDVLITRTFGFPSNSLLVCYERSV